MKETRLVRNSIDFMSKPKPITEEQMQADFDYYLAQKMLKKMCERKLITEDEFKKISVLNRKKFSPYLAGLME